VDDEYPEPRLVVGDLVRCVYDLYHYYYPIPISNPYDEKSHIKYGVITDIDYAKFGDIFGYEIIYLVLCTDGVSRFYSEHEISKIS
jgi:hypothetical protein